MGFLSEFGFDPMLFFAQVVNFLIIFYLLKRFMYKPVLEILKKRDNEIKKGLADAEEGHKILEEAEKKEKEILQSAQQKADKMINEAKVQALELKTKSEEATKLEAERIMVQAKETMAQEERATEERLTEKIGQISLNLLEKSLVGIFGKSEQEVILKKAKNQLQKQL